MTFKQTQTQPQTQIQSAPRISFSGERLHFVSHRKVGPRQSLRIRLTTGLVGRR